jgi:hypothetical protein
MHKTVEELQAMREAEAQKLWEFPLVFSPIYSGELAREVSNVLPMLESV